MVMKTKTIIESFYHVYDICLIIVQTERSFVTRDYKTWILVAFLLRVCNGGALDAKRVLETGVDSVCFDWERAK